MSGGIRPAYAERKQYVDARAYSRLDVVYSFSVSDISQRPLFEEPDVGNRKIHLPQPRVTDLTPHLSLVVERKERTLPRLKDAE